MNARELEVSVYKGGKQRRKNGWLGFVCFKRPLSCRNAKMLKLYIYLTPSVSQTLSASLACKIDVDYGSVIDDKTWRMI